jgi:hypothetical protein
MQGALQHPVPLQTRLHGESGLLGFLCFLIAQIRSGKIDQVVGWW